MDVNQSSVLRCLSFISKKVVVISMLGLLAACGGGGSETPEIIDRTPPPPPPVEPAAKITDANTGDIGTIILLLGEGAVEVSELIESEMLWFYHAPAEIVVRDCPNGGTVTWELPTDNKLTNSATMLYDNCERAVNNSPALFTGAVSIDFEITTYTELLDLSQQEIISVLTLSMQANELQAAEPNSSEFIPIKFDMTSVIAQQYEDNSNEFPLGVEKTKNLQITEFAFDLDENQSERIYQGVASQFESANANTDGFYYVFNIDAKYQSSAYNLVADLTGEVTSSEFIENTNYAERDIDGTFSISVGTENLTASFNKEVIDVASSSGFVGQALTYQILEDTTFRLKSNYAMYFEIQKETPLKLVGFAPDSIIEEDDQHIALTFNKLLGDSTSVGLQYPKSWALDSEFTVLNKNQVRIDLASINNLKGTFNLYNIDLISISYNASAYKVQPWQETAGNKSFVVQGKGSVIALEAPVDEIDIYSNGELVGLNGSTNENSQVYRFAADGKIVDQGSIDMLLSNLCVDPEMDNLYFTTWITGDGTEYQRDILQFDADFSLLQRWFLDDKTDFRVQCQNDFIFYYDIAPRAGALDSGYFGQHIFNFADNSLTDLGFDDHDPGIYKAVNKVTQSQTYSLIQSSYHQGDFQYQNVFEIIEEDFSAAPAEKTVLPLDRTALEIDDFGFTDFPLRTSDDNQLLFDNNVVDLNTLNVLHEFSQQEDDGSFEYIRYQNDTYKLIVTSRSVYDSQTYQKLFDLPYIDRAQTEENWFVDNEQRLNILINSNWLYQSPPLR